MPRKECVAVNCIVCGGKESAAIEPIESGNKLGALKETKEGRVIWIFGQFNYESGRECVGVRRIERGLRMEGCKGVREEGEDDVVETHLREEQLRGRGNAGASYV